MVYFIVLGILAGFFFGARVYGKISQEKLEKTRRQSMNGGKKEIGVKVKVCEVFYQPLVDVLKLPGSVEAYNEIELATRIGGAIEWIGKEEGEPVKKGEKLLVLDTSLIEAQKQRFKTSYDLALKKFNRIKNLYEKDMTSRESFDESAAAVESAKAALKEVEVSLEYGTLVSPLDGVLDRRYVDPGEYVDPGKTIMKIVDIDRVKVVFMIPEKDILFFKQGQKVTLKTSNGGQHEFEGIVEFVALTADPVSRTYPLKVVVDNPDHNLRPGMILRSSLVRRKIQNAIAVPFYTLVDNEKGKSVFVVENGKAVEKPIQYGVFQGSLIEITKGLELGDVLVVVGQRNLVNGENVTITDNLTTAAKAYLAAGKDISQLTLDILYSKGAKAQ